MLIPNLSVLLAERRLTLTRVARDTGISRTTLTALTGRAAKGIQFDTLNRLCQYLKVAPEALFIYRPFDLSLSVTGVLGHSQATLTASDAAGVRRFPLACDAEGVYGPAGRLEALRVRLSLPENADPRAEALLRDLPPSALADLERDVLAAFDRNIDPALAPDDYTPDLRWPWDAP